MTDGGIYKGPREDGVDYFDDIMGDNSPPALFDTDFGGGGMRNYDTVKWSPTPTGIQYKMHCRTCPSHVQIDVTWAELFVAAHAPRTQILPQGWVWSKPNGAPYPNLHCNSCGALAAPIIPPQWAAAQVDAALREGLISPQQLVNDAEVRAVQSRLAQMGPQGGQGGPQGQY